MEVSDHIFVLDGGHRIVEGKSQWPDLVRVMIPKDRALQIAMDILTRLQNVREGENMLFELALLGKLEALGEGGEVISSTTCHS